MSGFTKYIWVSIALLCWSSSISSQSRSQLEEERNRIIDQIELTSNSLEKAANKKKTTLADLKAVEKQIESRKELIQNIQSQLKSADQVIAVNGSKIDSLDSNMGSINNQYTQLARNMYIRELAGNNWAYIFSAGSVNDLFLRWRYTKQFEAYADQKVNQTIVLKDKIESRTNTVKEEKTYVQSLLEDEKKNYVKLEQDQKRKDEILAQLKSKESTLRSELKSKKAQREKLNKEIEKVILAALSKSSTATKTSTSKRIENKNLAWPSNGYISGNFGNQTHPTLKNVTINNNGIDITCKANAAVSSVADGKVISTTTMAGYGNMVIIKHPGDYYSVYSKLEHIIVKLDESIQTGQTIGRLSNENAPELHFEFWKDKQKLNPANWLQKK